MLQKPADDGAHPDVLGNAWHAGPQGADAAHDQIHLDARLAGLVKRLDDLRLHQRVHFRHHPGRLAEAGVLRLRVNEVQHGFVQGERRLQQLLQPPGPAHGRQLLEHLLHVVAHRFVAGEQAVVRVQPGGARVVVARAKVNVALQDAAFASYHHAHFGMGLVPDNAVNHLGAGALQVVGEFYVGRLVEARPQFDDHRHLLAVGGGVGERLHHRRLGAGPIERLADGQHLRVLGGLAQKLQDRRKGLKGMVQQNVSGGDGLKHVVGAANALRHRRHEPWILEVRAVHQIRHGGQAHQVHRPVAAVKVVRRQVELRHQKGFELLWAILGHFKAHRIAVAARRQLSLQRPQQVVHLLFVHKEVAVARNPKLIDAGGLHAGEQLVHVRVDDRRKQDEVIRPFGAGLRQPHHPGQGPGRLDDGLAAVAAKGVLALEVDDERQALVQGVREWMGRVQADGAHDGRQFMIEVALDPLSLGVAPFLLVDEADVLCAQGRQQHFVQHRILLVYDRSSGLGDAPQLLRRRKVVRAALHGAVGLLLLEAGDPYFKKLVQQGAGDAEKAQPFKQRQRFRLGLGQHPPVELQQRELPIDVEVRVAGRFGVHGQPLA